MRSLDPIVGGPVGTGESLPVECCAQQPSPSCEAEQRRVPELGLLDVPTAGSEPHETRRTGVETAAAGGVSPARALPRGSKTVVAGFSLVQPER
jgi:hypothetical protein